MDINVLIRNNVDVNLGIELSRGIVLYNETMEHFLNNINENIAKIKEAKSLGNLEDYAMLLEKLKIDAKNLGFIGVADIANKHEINAKTRDMTFVINNFDELIESINNMVNIANEYMESKTEVVMPQETVQVQQEVPTKHKILVVDDSNIVRNLIKRMVKDDYEMLNANDGQEAIEILKDEHELVGILLDLNMPNVNGFEVLEYCAKNNLFEKMSVAIITGDDSRETVLKAFDYPIVDVLAKPFNENDVKRVITAMLTHK